jgi:hypothetical protein
MATSSIKQLSDGNPDGVVLGQDSSDKISFYGADPVARPTNVASVTTTGASSTTNAYGYTTAAQADAIVTSVNAILTRLNTLGLFASS